MFTIIITHALALLLGGGTGWYAKGRFGQKIAQVVTDVKQIPKP